MYRNGGLLKAFAVGDRDFGTELATCSSVVARC